jgi:hypothetical protein
VNLKDYAKRDTLKRALVYLAAIKNAWNAYQEDRDAWYTTGDGKRRGYRYPYCFHGASLWTDYDNICAGCEDGFNGYNPMTFYRYALDNAKTDYAVAASRCEWLWGSKELHELPSDLRNQLIDWCMEPMSREVGF